MRTGSSSKNAISFGLSIVVILLFVYLISHFYILSALLIYLLMGFIIWLQLCVLDGMPLVWWKVITGWLPALLSKKVIRWAVNKDRLEV